ncbi:MAG: cyclic nucleotide-binding domain-containing protein [Deltaproteobacteria bacterium]|nr:cyclic nucleotide-binding domain-containing protein [Deltaproteobacteria bacterium]
MPRTLQDLRDEADRRLAEGKTIDALKVYRLVLEGEPLDFELRLEIGDIVASLGQRDLASNVYLAVAEHDVKSGNPLRAMAALNRPNSFGGEVTSAKALLTQYYSADSSMLGRGIKPAPADLSAEVREDLDIDYAIDEAKLVLETANMAAFTDNIENYPGVVPPVPIFSTLKRMAFTELLTKLSLKQFKPGEAIVRQGDPGEAVFFIARGEVSVVRSQDSEEDEQLVHLARLGPGSIFGEMALVSTDPRSASVVCETAVDALELTRENIEELAFKIAQVGGAMARFTQERMISNLLATNPIFKPFDEEQQKNLLSRFTGHEVPAETIFLEQQTPGKGLYVILRGHAEVLKYQDGEYTKIAELGPGDVAGEISLLFEEPVSATVRTTTPTTLLFLAREIFMPLVEAIPELLAHFNKLAEERLVDTDFKMMQRTVVDDDFIEELDEDADISDDDLVFI